MTTLIAKRTRKARKPTRCALDNCPISVGNRIGLVDSIGWAKVTCIVRKQNTETTENHA